jgi:hypothetical protein
VVPVFYTLLASKHRRIEADDEEVEGTPAAQPA